MLNGFSHFLEGRFDDEALTRRAAGELRLGDKIGGVTPVPGSNIFIAGLHKGQSGRRLKDNPIGPDGREIEKIKVGTRYYWGDAESLNGLPIYDPIDEVQPPALMSFDQDEPELAKRLLKLGADPNAVFEAGHGRPEQTPLHCAVKKGLLQVAKVLLAAGVDPAIEDSYGRTPLQMVVEEQLNRKDVLRIAADLLERCGTFEKAGVTAKQLILLATPKSAEQGSSSVDDSALQDLEREFSTAARAGSGFEARQIAKKMNAAGADAAFWGAPLGRLEAEKAKLGQAGDFRGVRQLQSEISIRRVQVNVVKAHTKITAELTAEEKARKMAASATVESVAALLRSA